MFTYLNIVWFFLTDLLKQVGKLLPDAYEPDTIPLVGELDELETFVGQKK